MSGSDGMSSKEASVAIEKMLKMQEKIEVPAEGGGAAEEGKGKENDTTLTAAATREVAWAVVYAKCPNSTITSTQQYTYNNPYLLRAQTTLSILFTVCNKLPGYTILLIYRAHRRCSPCLGSPLPKKG